VCRLGLPPRVDVLKAARAAQDFQRQLFPRAPSIPPEEIRSLRAEMLLTAVKSFAPAVVLVDKHPSARRRIPRDWTCQGTRRKAVLAAARHLDEPEHVWANGGLIKCSKHRGI